jgi:hypothetical protein
MEFEPAEKEELVRLYREVPLPSDRLPYTEPFDWMREMFCNRIGRVVSHHDVWLLLTRLRKGGRLPPKG